MSARIGVAGLLIAAGALILDGGCILASHGGECSIQEPRGAVADFTIGGTGDSTVEVGPMQACGDRHASLIVAHGAARLSDEDLYDYLFGFNNEMPEEVLVFQAEVTEQFCGGGYPRTALWTYSFRMAQEIAERLVPKLRGDGLGAELVLLVEPEGFCQP